jgi:hypothetical protein
VRRFSLRKVPPMAYAASEPVVAPYANWFQRVDAYLIDAVLPAVIYLADKIIHTVVVYV